MQGYEGENSAIDRAKQLQTLLNHAEMRYNISESGVLTWTTNGTGLLNVWLINLVKNLFNDMLIAVPVVYQL